MRHWTMKHHQQLFRCFWRTLVAVLLFEGTPLVMFRGTLTLTLNRDDSSFTRITHSFHNVTSHRRELKPLAKTRPFAFVNGHRRSLSDVLQNGHPDRLLCGLQVGSSLYVLELEKNQDLLPKPPNVFYYLPNGTGVSMKENLVTHCYYHGSVQGYPQSRVVLSSCSGLRGVIVINATLSFELHPEEEKHEKEEEGSGEMEEGWMHVIYTTHPQTSESRDCGVSHTSIPRIQITPHTHRSKRDILSETKYIELVLVADHIEYLNYQKNNKTIIYRMLDVANQVDWFYRPLNVRVALLGLEIWSDQDKIKVDKNPTETLNRFLDWRTRELLPRLRHDNAQLIMGESFDGTTVGMASQSSMCSKDRSGGVNVDHLVSVLGVASTVAHELGHNLGMSHDTADRRCQCQNEPRLGGCIMEPSTGFMPGQLFSSCSERDLSLCLLHGGGMCLFNVPQPESLLGGPRCGNLYVEKGEECDCGLLDECTDPCCNASTCKLVPGAQCSSDGICCENCKLRVAGSVCREPLGDCDLPEYCTGTSPYCPPNLFLQNGESCKDGSSYCYSGVCASLDEQCQMLWGPNSTHAPPICFSSVNKQGNKYGNCGQMPNGSYIPCLKWDVHCGRIQCQGGNERPLLGSNVEILTTTVKLNQSDFTCRGAYFNLGDDVSDPAMVSQGTACGPNKACVDQKCRDVSMFGVEECRRKCNGHGVCNSNKNCHCDEGWAPPDCRYSGTGGSVDSGPAREPRVFSLVFVRIQIQILRGWLCWSFSCLCYRSRCWLSHSASPAVDEALCTSATPPSTRADRAGLLPWSLQMLEMEIRCNRSGTSGPTRATSLSPRLSARSKTGLLLQLNLFHLILLLNPLSPQEHDRLHQASLSLLTLSSLPARTLFPPNLQFPRNHCLWILHPTLIHPHCWDIQDPPHLHHLTHVTLYQLLLLPDLPLIRLYGDSSTLRNPTLLTKYSQEGSAGPAANLWTTLFFFVLFNGKKNNGVI
ncbi:disintegrin and metalloproteinase domain-containing protein 15 isoform X4 [Sinocyclocheilus rhinocerous]|uniref:disintegrin and metalloproteinase domain-containing protein 15 isoform X4 n=1 Tax=Sinocyclocheilus rhinocerous TaxID=307959 RepID=UPI0007B8E927|nr:PREDICTED: disintegrin and metalloproteinase domain-containing protein 15 isoform X4 [Sinocyclocheilus rhinocerous]